MSTSQNRPAVPAQDEADVLEQQVPAVPEAPEDPGGEAAVRGHGDPLLPEGSEADRLEQDADGGSADVEEDEYPREIPDEDRA